MPRKRIADTDPAIPQEGAVAQSAKAPVSSQAPTAKKARAPRASANAVTHRHKKTAAVEQPAAPVPAAESAPPTIAETGTAFSLETTVVTPVAAPTATVLSAPTNEEISFRAYLLAESRGFVNGSPDQDWLEAERQLRAERSAR